MRVEIWSDVVCPWCYIAKRNFEVALRRFAHRDRVEVVWRSYELDPSAPAVPAADYVSTIANKYGMTVPATQKMVETIIATARFSGLILDLDRARPGNTHDAHRLLHLAESRGCRREVKERFLRAALMEGEPLGDPATLKRLAIDAGLPGDAVRDVLTDGAFAAAVRADEQRAAALGVTGVPFFLLDGAFRLAGAQSPNVLLHALEVVFAKSAPAVRREPDNPRISSTCT